MEKLQSNHFFLKVSLIFQRAPEFLVDAVKVKMVMMAALQSLHGQVGLSIPIDVLYVHGTEVQRSGIASTLSILRVPCGEVVRVWSALTLLGSYDGKLCAFRVCQLSSSLVSLAVFSRDNWCSVRDCEDFC